jgi:spermidine/putrescine transport system substrate-binding protein
MDRIDRRGFLHGSALLGGAVLLGGCGASQGIRSSSSSTGAAAAGTTGAGATTAGATSAGASTTVAATSYPGSLASEKGHLTIAEWAGYEAAGTKPQTYGLTAGADYVKRYGGSKLTYADYGNDDKNLNAMKAGQHFDLLHPCIDYVQDYVAADLVEPFDTRLIPSFSKLYPELVARGQVDGKQYWIPWDWGFGSILYRKDKVDPADALSWDLLFNEKYKGRISMWDGGSIPVQVAGLVTDPPAKDIFAQTPDELERSKALLIKQKPLNKFYWTSEYGNQQPAFKSGDIWITYAWPNDYQALGSALGYDKVGYVTPKEGKLAWVCGFMMGKGTKSPLHAHAYVESFLGHAAGLNLINTYSYGSSNSTVMPTEVKDQRLSRQLQIGNPNALKPPVHLERHVNDRAAYQKVWAEVKAS